MKRTICILLSILLSLSLFAGGANSQKIYSVDSSVYKDITTIYIVTGHAAPSTTGPWSGDELEKMVSALNLNSIPEEYKEIYDRIIAELGVEAEYNLDGAAMNLDGYLNLDIYVHTYNSDAITRKDRNGIEETAFAGRSYWFGKDLSKNTPFFEIDWDTYFGDHFYTFFNAYLANSVRGKKEIGSTRFNSNIPAFQNLFDLDVKLLDINFPSRAFLSFGGNGWSVQIGRDRLSWGSGTTGNLVLSDNFPYYDIARFTAYSPRYKYTYLLSFFPNKENYYTATSYNANDHNTSAIEMKGISFYAAHRFEGRLFDDKLTLAVTEALTYMSETSSIQFGAISPMYFMHNAFMPTNSNSTFTIEVNWTVMKGLLIYGQFLLDNFALPVFDTLPGPNLGEDTTPDAKAYLIGAKYITKLSDGLFTLNPEVVYVTPYTYIRDGYSGWGYGLDYVAAVKYRLYSFNEITDSDVLYDEYVIGYKYGPDTLVANLSASWEKDRLTLGAKTFFMMHGTHDLWTIWTKIPAHTTEEDYKKQHSGITTDHSNTGNYRYDSVNERNSIWYTLDIGVSAEYELLDNLTLNAALDFVMMNNIYNVKGNNAHDFQLILGVSYKPF